MQSLTANQLILLLQIYRGTLDKEFKIGTYLDDLQHLMAKRLIVEGPQGSSSKLFNHGFETTETGDTRCKEALR